MWTVRVEQNDLTFNNQRWDIKKTQQMIWQGLLEYAKHAWDITREDANGVVVYDNALGNYDRISGGNEPLYHKDNTRMMHWNIRTPKMGLVNHT